MKTKKQLKWEWSGLPKHFCCADRCLFHLATKIGNIVISTVGAMMEEGTGDFKEIGCDRLYETMVFEAKKADCTCCKWSANVSEQLRWFAGYNSPEDATNGHMAICKKVERYLLKKKGSK